MEFYQTNGGKKFFEVQLPKLNRALEDVTEAFNRQDDPRVLAGGVGDDFLRELYFGNVGIGVSVTEG